MVTRTLIVRSADMSDLSAMGPDGPRKRKGTVTAVKPGGKSSSRKSATRDTFAVVLAHKGIGKKYQWMFDGKPSGIIFKAWENETFLESLEIISRPDHEFLITFWAGLKVKKK